jgi:uncharacterized protein (TIGR00299 family) protein
MTKASAESQKRSALAVSRRRTKIEKDRILHLDTFSGIAGNMFLGAMLDAGLSRRVLDSDLAGLGVDFRLRVRKVKRGALGARHVEIGIPRQAPSAERRGRSAPAVSRRRTKIDRAGKASRRVGRRYSEIRRLLDRAELAAPVRDRAQEIFEELARAESKTHGVKIEEVHFHELGAIDAIVDVTGAAIAMERLRVKGVTATPPALGHGAVKTRHGTLPLPSPATLELLKGIPTVPAHVAWETVTPTGAAILKTVVDEFRTLPAMTVEAVGYGAGDDREGPMPNLLRAVLGRSGAAGWDRILSLEVNLDDLVPEHFDHLMECLFEAGALDVSIQHVQMKKNRPGFLLRVLARPSNRSALSAILFAETPTLGVRAVECDRLVLERETRRVETPFGRIAVKVARGEAGRIDVSAEYDDCKRAARRSGAPLRDVVRAAEEAARR